MVVRGKEAARIPVSTGRRDIDTVGQAAARVGAAGG